MIINDTDKNLNDYATISRYMLHKKLIQQALNTNEGGYIWHTTGSGKHSLLLNVGNY